MKLTTYPAASAGAALVLAHGAGAGQKSPAMVRTAQGLSRRGISAATFDFPYMAEGRHAPDKTPVLEACWRDALAAAAGEFRGLALFIGGRSMGGRIASQIAAQSVTGIAGLVFLAYPLHPPGKPNQLRDAHLPDIAEPMLFVQGTRDPFGTSAEIAALLPRLRTATLHEVAGGDHSFNVPGRKGKDDVLEGILDAVARWVQDRAKR